jgi:large subunit ribosomal protein L19
MAKLNKQKLINSLEKAQMRFDLPSFGPGDSVVVHSKIIEGNKTRLQKFDCVFQIISCKNLSKSFIVRKESSGIGVEQTFPFHSPLIVKIEVVKKGRVRRAYISYMRNRSGKLARIKTAK